jgi:hypothetical protein
MRKDLASAGFGLPWSFQNPPATTNKEAADSETIAVNYNDWPNVPRAVCGGNNLASADQTQLLSGTDYLVIRSTSAGTTQAGQCWSYLNYTGITKPPSPLKPKSWTAENLQNNDLVIVVKMDLTSNFSKQLVMDGANFYTTYNALTNFEPYESKVTNYVFGVHRPLNNDVTALRMPFNRADYYVRRPTGEAIQVPGRCAPNTGILFKALVSQADGTLRSGELPLLDCVADMQVVYSLDSASNGVVTDTDSILTLSADDIRTELKIIQVYILTHDGGKDSSFTYPNQFIAVGPSPDGITTGSGRSFDLLNNIGTGWQNYRWKVYRIIVNPTNMNISTQ